MCGWVDAAPSRRRLLKCCLMPGRSADRTAQGFTVDSKPAKHEVLIRRPMVLYGAAFLLRDAGACRDGAVVMGIHGHERSHIYF